MAIFITSLIKNKSYMLFELVIPFLGIIVKEIISDIEKYCSNVFTAAVLKIAKIRNFFY